MRLRCVLFIGALACCGQVVGAAQSRGGTYTLAGRVLSHVSRPAVNLWVLVYEGNVLRGRSLTGDDGSYFIPRLEAKTYIIIVKKDLRSSQDLFRSDVRLPLTSSFIIRLP
jgi:hypothetical protein